MIAYKVGVAREIKSIYFFAMFLQKILVPVHGKTKGVGIEFAYVPLSRVRRLQDLTILRPFNPSILNNKVNEGCARMMEEFKRKDLCKDM